ncbi:LysR substrate-binding domain-containing protein [Clavibacter michiganensis]|uniref:LysR substrate-binding domain-containing protein n=2 Tax=Clavibacter michiganensis TaxID=28447 RepID=UPI001D0BA1C4|nr:LysR substrate-binding domain-containing protein [Clavibacter michiganensis]MDO4045570.1 LysR substrate-binding domain-containing protein [Clavibacter michiganensis]MDO4053771.1 LysR substrate-binding domain-containing protein [Clavibacter michiganensis]MDO4057989.1 LysR substrate-binding domain-containing protein [Clavibacter michiganensis]MDO4067036.1 LysR substrate-binding domain-containing protein [Clavibacter michiganensis]MDO4070108.1 LysR substrate-binding domain-containing protein [
MTDAPPPARDLDSAALAAVHALAVRGSITAAAASLGVSQPALSQTLRRLEARIGVPVTARAGRGVVLTEAGRVLARHAETVVHAIDQAADELDDLRGLRAGTVRVAAFPSASSTVVPRLLGGLAAAHPGLGFGYLEAEPPEAVAAVRAREADVAVTFAYPDDPDDPGARSLDGLESRPLWRETLWAVLPESRALRHRGPLALHDLAADRWIAGCVRCRRHLVSACARSGFAPATSFETDNAAAAVGMVQAGLGVALLPSLALATAPLPRGVVRRRISGVGERVVHVVTAPGGSASPAVHAAVAALVRLRVGDWELRRA